MASENVLRFVQRASESTVLPSLTARENASLRIPDSA